MLDYTSHEWALFSRIEKRIILMNRVHNMDKEQIRANLTWPLEPLSEVTWRGHWARLMKKMAKIRMCRITQNPSHQSKQE